MTDWIQLTPNQAHFRYRVPLEIASTENNVFFSTQRQPGIDRFDDGPWPFWALLREEGKPNIVKLCICTVEFEALEFEGFNPLREQGGYLSLSKKELSNFVDLLLSRVAELPSSSSDKRDQQMFRELKDSEAVDFRLHPEWFEDEKESYYQQVRNPLAKTELDSTITLLIFSTGNIHRPTSRLFFQIIRFSSQSLQEESFDPQDQGLAQVYLDRAGMEELALLIDAERKKLVD